MGLCGRLIVPVLLLFSVCGCGTAGSAEVPTGTVTGTVKLDGQPLGDATVTFFEEEHAYSASALTGADGSYSLRHGGGSRIPVGKYKVQVTPKEEVAPPPAAGGEAPTPKTSPIPEKYRKFQTSGLTAEVKAGATPVDLELKK